MLNPSFVGRHSPWVGKESPEDSARAFGTKHQFPERLVGEGKGGGCFSR